MQLEQILSKSYSYLIQTLICIIIFAYIICDDVIQLSSKDNWTAGTESFILIAWKLLIAWSFWLVTFPWTFES